MKAILLALLGAALLPGAVSAQADFYKGKNLTRDYLGPGSRWIRRVVNQGVSFFFLQEEYTRGNLTIVMEHMAGGGGRKVDNDLDPAARPDGFLPIGNRSRRNDLQRHSGRILVSNTYLKVSYLGSPATTYHAVFC